jgi:hypothetical protein
MALLTTRRLRLFAATISQPPQLVIGELLSELRPSLERGSADDPWSYGHAELAHGTYDNSKTTMQMKRGNKAVKNAAKWVRSFLLPGTSELLYEARLQLSQSRRKPLECMYV